MNALIFAPTAVYPKSELVAGMDIEVMKVVRLKRA